MSAFHLKFLVFQHVMEKVSLELFYLKRTLMDFSKQWVSFLQNSPQRLQLFKNYSYKKCWISFKCCSPSCIMPQYFSKVIFCSFCRAVANGMSPASNNLPGWRGMALPLVLFPFHANSRAEGGEKGSTPLLLSIVLVWNLMLVLSEYIL